MTTNRGAKNKNYSGELDKLGAKIFEIGLIRKPFVYDIRGLLRLLSEMKNADITYIFEPPPGLGPLLAICSAILKKKTIRGRHNPFHYTSDISGGTPKHLKLVRLYEKTNLFFDSFFTINHVQNTIHRDYLLKQGFANVVVIPACLDFSDYSPGVKFPEFTALFLGRMNYHKGTDRIPSIIREVNARTEKIRFIIGGGGLLEKDLKAKLSSEENVVFAGFVDEREKMRLLSSCHVLISPTRVEAFMLSGVEAMASGTPVITFNVPGPSDYVQNGINGFLCDDTDSCASGIFELHNRWKNGTYGEMSMAARRTGEGFDCSLILKSMEEVFKKTA